MGPLNFYSLSKLVLSTRQWNKRVLRTLESSHPANQLEVSNHITRPAGIRALASMGTTLGRRRSRTKQTVDHRAAGKQSRLKISNSSKAHPSRRSPARQSRQKQCRQ